MAVQRSLSSRSQDTADLLGNFVQEFAPPTVVSRLGDVSTSGATSSDIQHLGSNLRKIAVDFGESRQRQQVTDLANQASLSNLSLAQLRQLLSNLMEDARAGGQYLMERIVVAFYFCIDILKRVAEWALEKVTEFFFVVRDAVVSVINPIVEGVGGWHAILVSIGSYIARRYLLP